jgi:hypothetical protein
VVEFADVPDGEDSVTVFSVVTFYNLVDGYLRFVASSSRIKIRMEIIFSS